MAAGDLGSVPADNDGGQPWRCRKECEAAPRLFRRRPDWLHAARAGRRKCVCAGDAPVLSVRLCRDQHRNLSGGACSGRPGRRRHARRICRSGKTIAVAGSFASDVPFVAGRHSVCDRFLGQVVRLYGHLSGRSGMDGCRRCGARSGRSFYYLQVARAAYMAKPTHQRTGASRTVAGRNDCRLSATRRRNGCLSSADSKKPAKAPPTRSYPPASQHRVFCPAATKHATVSSW